MKKIVNWIKKNKLDFILLVGILALGFFLRFYQFSGHVTFLGDEGRDALVVKRMIVDHKFTLLGPTISFGNLYLGPIYYYFMIIPLWFSNLDPVGPAVMVGLFGFFTIFLVWLSGKDFFGTKAGMVASLLYAVSPLVITHTRSSWNPNPMPFFSMLVIYSLFRTAKDKDGKWLILLGACLGVTLQLHYIAFILIFSVIFILVVLRIKIPLKWNIVCLFAFILVISPQILFEIRHGFVNIKAMFNLMLKKGEFVESAGVGFKRFMPLFLYNRLFQSLVLVKRSIPGIVLGLFCGVVAVFSLIKEKSLRKNPGFLILVLWILFGVLGIPLYQGTIHDHYLGFLFPAPFLLFGYCAGYLWDTRKNLIRIIVFLTVFIITAFNLSQTNVLAKIGPNYQVVRVKTVAKTIADDVGDKKYNIAVVSATKDFMGYNYRYFLELFGKIPENYDNFNNIDVLYVIEETKWVSPEELGLWEVGTFGPFTVTRNWTFDFQVVLYRLDHKK